MNKHYKKSIFHMIRKIRKEAVLRYIYIIVKDVYEEVKGGGADE